MGKSYWVENQQGNFSNNQNDTFDGKKRYIGLRLQQGVPLLDRDWNELEDIRRYEEQMLRKHYIGNGTPDDGFRISACDSPDNDFKIGAGNCLVDGFEVVNKPKGEQYICYTDQKLEEALTPPKDGERVDMVYLDAWIEEVRSQGKDDPLNNPQDLNEETTVRHRLVWRVRVDEGSKGKYRKSEYHHYYDIARIKRVEGEKKILDENIKDLREARGKDKTTIQSLTFKNDKVPANAWPKLTCEAANQLDVSGDLIVKDSGKVGIGTPTPQTKLDVQGDIRINDQDFWLRGGTDKNHGIGWYGLGKLFANTNLDGPAVFGCSGGALGTVCSGQKIALKWDSAGNVGIGESFPSGVLQQKLEVNGNVWVIGGVGIGIGDPRDIKGNNKLLVDGNLHMNGHPIYLRQGFGDQFDVIQWNSSYDRVDIGGYNGVNLCYTNGANNPVIPKPALSVDAKGNVGIGINYPGARLHVEATDKPTIMAQGSFGGLVSGSGGGHGVFGTNIYTDLNNQLKTAGTHDANYGYAGMHATWSSIRFYAADGNTTENGGINPLPRLVISPYEIKHFVKCSQASSRELKKDIHDLSITEAFKVLESLNPVTFVMKDDREETLQVGFIAEEAPDLAATADRKGIVNNNIVAVLTKVIKEQQKEVKSLIDDVKILKTNIGGITS